MSMEQVERVAETVLYEGYMLFPYRRSSLKNQQRWTFGGVYPRRYSEQGGGDDPWDMVTECLVAGDERTAIEVKVRFLQVADLLVAERTDGALVSVEALRVGDVVYRPWEEAIERTVAVPGLQGASPLRIGDLVDGGRSLAIAVSAGRSEEPLIDQDGAQPGALIREWQTLEGLVEIAAEPLGSSGGSRAMPRGYRLRIRIMNLTPWAGIGAPTASEARSAALRQTFVSTHTILRARGGEFVSLLEPPATYQEEAARCTNIRTWPVLVGQPGERHTVLSSPIILYDYPQIAPESTGDFFDATEIDELLTLSIMTLSDEEKQEMRESDPRTRAMLERTELLTPEQIARLHGAVRSLQVLRDDSPWDDDSPQRHRDTERERGGLGAWVAMAAPGHDGLNSLVGGAGMDPFWALERAAPAGVQIGGVEITRGSRVRLHPRLGGDIFDLALAGKIAFVEAIEQDFEDTIHVAVTVEDDPGRDLGDLRQPGHRFFFSLDEIEPLAEWRDGSL